MTKKRRKMPIHFYVRKTIQGKRNLIKNQKKTKLLTAGVNPSNIFHSIIYYLLLYVEICVIKRTFIIKFMPSFTTKKILIEVNSIT